MAALFIMSNKITPKERIKKVRTAPERNSLVKTPHEVVVARIKISAKVKMLKRMILSLLVDENLELHFVVNREIEIKRHEKRISSGMERGAEKIFGRSLYNFDLPTIILEENEESEEIISEDDVCEYEYLPTKRLSEYDILRLKYYKYTAKVIKGGFLGIRGNVQIRKIIPPGNSTYLFSEKMRYEDFIHLTADLGQHTDLGCIVESNKQFERDFFSGAYKWVKCVVTLSQT